MYIEDQLILLPCRRLLSSWIQHAFFLVGDRLDAYSSSCGDYWTRDDFSPRRARAADGSSNFWRTQSSTIALTKVVLVRLAEEEGHSHSSCWEASTSFSSECSSAGVFPELLTRLI
jgi:hypothetical protein